MRLKFILILLLAKTLCFSQNHVGEKHSKIFNRIDRISADTVFARKCVGLAEYFLERKDSGQLQMDSAERCISTALNIAMHNGSPSLIQEVKHLQARCYFKIHDLEKGSRIFLAEINSYHELGLLNDEAQSWFDYAKSLMFWDATSPDVFFQSDLLYDDYTPVMLKNIENARKLANATGNSDLLSAILTHMIVYHMEIGDYKTASNEIQVLLPLQSLTKVPALYDLRLLQEKDAIWYAKDYVNGAAYCLETIKTAAESHRSERAIQSYGDLGYIYGMITNPEESALDFKKYIDQCHLYNIPPDPQLLRYYIPALVTLNRADEARKILQSFNVNNPSYDLRRKILIYEAYGTVNVTLQDFAAAETFYFKALKLTESDKLFVANKRGTIIAMIGRMYVKWKKYDKARPYEELVINKFGSVTGKSSVANAYNYLYQIDSAAGNYLSAIRNLKTSDSIKNSLALEDTKKTVADLNLKYATAQKEQQILTLNNTIRLQKLDSINKAKNIELLNGKVQLDKVESASRKRNIELLDSRLKLQQLQASNKERNIQLLGTRIKLQQSDSASRVKDMKVLAGTSLLQQSKLQRTMLVRNITLGGAFLLLIILALLFNQARINRHNNLIVSENNIALKHLLQDKEILMKEIHHRVKNNLQMILSLLESQSAFLENDALMAIQTSQNRVQAMSLIHQKLYLTDELATIDMPDYLRELITYLEDSFNISQRIYFNLETEDIGLDISQAVPLGLIVNEAVTNAIKYAFPQGGRGEITISLKKGINHLVTLMVCDNGIGLPENFMNSKNSSLGLRLIRGLSDNLEANLQIRNNRGTLISLVFSSALVLQV